MGDPFDRIETIHPEGLERLAATLDVPPPVGVPPLWHWTSFLDGSPTSALGEDGHPRSGGLVEHPPHPRRMFAGGRMRWHNPIPAGVPVRRRASVSEIIHKDGSKGPLAFVTVSLTYSVEGTVIAVEEQDLVYLPVAATSTPLTTPVALTEDSDPQGLHERATFTETALFRFSALTFNTHRIHYDLPYAREVEGYPGLVIHGPLLIIRLLDVIRSTFGEDSISQLNFRAVSPAFCGSTVDFLGRRDGDRVDLVAAHNGRTLMKADVMLSNASG
jgi:3-methylfumaryl-CoA hydratase